MFSQGGAGGIMMDTNGLARSNHQI